MSPLLGLLYVFFLLFPFLIPKASYVSGDCRNLEFTSDHSFKGKRLVNHLIHVADAIDGRFCRILCFSNDSCISYNFMTRIEAGKHICELNNATHEEYGDDLETNSNYTYYAAMNPCVNNGCKNNATCQAGFTNRGYRCLCIPGFKGQDCDVNAYTSCKEIYDLNSYSENKAYQLKVGNEKISVYCHLRGNDLGACGEGGWTLVMKINGKKPTFHYDSNLWANKETLNAVGGQTGFDSKETELSTYWNTPFSKICLGMKFGQQLKFILIHKTADSLYSLIADGKYRATSLGRNTWKTIIGSQASLQPNCNKEGFNTKSPSMSYSRARIGYICNEQNNCASCDSRIGFGTGGYPDNSNTCGNAAKHHADNGDKLIKAMGYIFIQ